MIDLLGFFLPPVIDLINRKILDSDKRFWTSVLVCVVAALGFNFIENGGAFGDFEGIKNSVFVVFGLAQLSYKGVWEKSNVREKLALKAE